MKSWFSCVCLVVVGFLGACLFHESGATAQIAPNAPVVVGPIPGRYQISAYGYGGGGRDGAIGEGAYILDTATGESWRFSGNTLTYLGSPGAPRHDTRVIATR